MVVVNDEEKTDERWTYISFIRLSEGEGSHTSIFCLSFCSYYS